MKRILLIDKRMAKADITGYTRQDGTFVKPHTDKRQKHILFKKPAPHGLEAPQFGQGKAGGGQLGQISHNTPVPGSKEHPRLDEDGKAVFIHRPTKPSAPETWADPASAAVFTPLSEVPAELNGVAFVPWEDHPEGDDWNDVDGQIPLDEPEMDLPKGKQASTGVIIEEPDGRVWVVAPTNQFGGYHGTFPKGRVDEGLSHQANAIKETFEESGLQVEITGLVGDFTRTTTVTRYYTARRVGGTPADMGWESQAVALVPHDAIHKFLNRDVDRSIAAAAGLTGEVDPDLW